ncbi:MAG: sodium:solute symporter family protein, partial [Planctomycetota bacterium]
MNMTGVDWLIMLGVYAALVVGVLVTRRFMKSVADFLAAGRTAGRYLISVSQGIAGIGAITLVANMEMNLEAGFAMSWWGMSMTLFVTIILVTGWVSYRFRATRCLTMAEFFERRYNRKFRIFAGFVAYGSGIVNFGIYPAVGARFFIYFMGLPPEFELLGLTLETFPVAMLVLLLTALYFVLVGGQVAIIVTDFIQGLFTNVVFLVIPIYLLTKVSEQQIVDVLSVHAEGKSRIDPFDTGNVESFNFGFFMIGVVGVFYNALSWQGTQGYNTSAKSAHEAKMGGVLGLWRGVPSGIFMLLLPIIAVTVLQHPDFTATATHVDGVLEGVPNEALHSQLQTPLSLTRLLPAGLMGLFCAMMLAAFITTNDSYLHSWGSIFIQDVVMPLRKKPLSPDAHLRFLRWSIVGVALFIFCFSLIYRESEQIL